MIGLLSFAQQSLGLDLYPGQAAILDAWARSGKRRGVWCLGRRSGKGLMASVVALYDALVADYEGCLRPGELRFILAKASEQLFQ